MRLTPTWVPRSFCVPGRRIKLHPDDYYALGGARGGIDERWFSSTTPAQNGPLTSKNEGLSHIALEEGGKTVLFLLKDAITVWYQPPKQSHNIAPMTLQEYQKLMDSRK